MAPPLSNLTNPNVITADGQTVDATSWTTDWSTLTNYINNNLTASFNKFTTKGDILCYDGAAIRALSTVGVTDGWVLSKSSAAPYGLAWIAPPGLPFTTNGDILYYNAGASHRLPIGAESEQLTVVGGLPAWTAPGGLPPGMVMMWPFSIASIPAGWALMDGVSNITGSGINMQGVFPVGAGNQSPAATGGMGLLAPGVLGGDTSSGAGVGASYTFSVLTAAAQKGTTALNIGKSGPTASIVVTPRYMPLCFIELLP